MPKYRITTDAGTFEVTTGDEAPVNDKPLGVERSPITAADANWDETGEHPGLSLAANALSLGAGMAGPAVAASAGRIGSALWSGAKAAGPKLPIVGAPAKAFIGGALRSWRGAAAPIAAAAGSAAEEVATAGPRLRTLAQQIPQTVAETVGHFAGIRSAAETAAWANPVFKRLVAEIGEAAALQRWGLR